MYSAAVPYADAVCHMAGVRGQHYDVRHACMQLLTTAMAHMRMVHAFLCLITIHN